jgi:hypothetical protein
MSKFRTPVALAALLIAGPAMAGARYPFCDTCDRGDTCGDQRRGLDPKCVRDWNRRWNDAHTHRGYDHDDDDD